MDNEELLAQLADIHLPEPISWWPPAPGWWLVAVLGLLGVVALAWWTNVVLTRRRIRDVALGELENCYQRLLTSPVETLDSLKLRYVCEVNAVLRRVALVHFPREQVASLNGTAWVEFIRRTGDSGLLTEELANALSHGRFHRQCSIDADALLAMGRAWVKSLYARYRPAPPLDAPKDRPSHA